MITIRCTRALYLKPGVFPVAFLALALTVASCGGGDSEVDPGSPTPGDGNLLFNAGLEDGPDPWFGFTTAVDPDPQLHFTRTEAFAHSGKASAYLQMRDPAEAAAKARVYYLVQEVQPLEFPEVVSGYYRVENWKKGAVRQYLQFVVIAFGVDNLPGGFPNHQIRYPLAGIDSPPFAIGNAHFNFITRAEPVTGQWVKFETNVKADFERLWGAAPEDFEKIRILFEVRWDAKEAGSAAEADVYYDDLYLGSAAGAN